MIFLSIKDNIMQALYAGFRWIMLLLSSFVYRLIIFTYDIFTRLASAEILSDTAIMAIYQRVGLILGIFMIFKLSFSFIQIVVNPDSVNDSQKGVGNIVTKCIMVVVLLGIVPYIFAASFQISKAVIIDGIINNIILGTAGGADKEAGANLSYNLFIGTYKLSTDPAAISEDYEDDWDYDYGYEDCQKIATGMKSDHSDSKLRLEMVDHGTMNSSFTCLNYMYDATGQNSDSSDNTFLIQFDFLYTLIIGCLVAYLLLIYCIKAGMRIVQLAFLQLIAPVPIMSYLSPKKDGLFDKWVKMCITTYVDIFIRVAVIAFAAQLSLIILQDDTGNVLYTTTGSPEGLTWFFIQALVIVGLFLFAKQVPELLKDLFPSSGSASLGFGLKSPKKMFQEGMPDFAKKGYGAVSTGAATIGGNLRKGIGKTYDTIRDPSSKKGDVRKQLGRTLLGSLASGAKGMRYGAKTTDKAGREAAVKNAIDRTQSEYKLQDQGYGSSIPGLFTKKGRAGFVNKAGDSVRGYFGRDQKIGDLTSASDAASQAQNRKIALMEENYTGNISVEQSKTDSSKYIVTNLETGKVYTDSNGQVQYYTDADITSRWTEGNDALALAQERSKAGKLEGPNKALHQKENEQKQNK